MKLFQRSLARRMTVGFLMAYVAILLGLMLLMRTALQVENDDLFGSDVAIYLADDAVRLGARGEPALRPGSAFRGLAKAAPALWLTIDVRGRRLAYGAVPAAAHALMAKLPASVDTAEVRLPGPPFNGSSIRVETVDTPAGRARFAAGGVPTRAIGWNAWFTYLVRTELIYAVPALALLGMGAVAVVVPFVLRALRPLAREAAEVGPEQLTRRLSESGTVLELKPVVQGFNRALDRLAEAFDRQRRFVADVAHELRTPVAILGAQVDLLPDLPAKDDLRRGVSRLGGLVGQMLDAERLVLADRRREPTDLVGLARAKAAEIAPLAIAAGYDVAFETSDHAVVADIDAQAVGRAITNLLGNAVAHGGHRGTIVLRVAGAMIAVEDEGPGVAPEARERVFEPFRRERWDRDGCGLGLYLVRQIVRAHGGDVTITDAATGGAAFRIALPSAIVCPG